ncbi:hypothetical protein TNCV_452141 [Trichonephila clavipes]|nr:hypothetical protein TNCV_452141 [Trichonephila clavipes]
MLSFHLSSSDPMIAAASGVYSTKTLRMKKNPEGPKHVKKGPQHDRQVTKNDANLALSPRFRHYNAGLVLALYIQICADFQDAKNRQLPCRMFVRYVKDP